MPREPSAYDRHSVFVGRIAERRRVETMLEEARVGGARPLVVIGEPGIGKSELLAQVAAEADGWRVLSAQGVPAESDLPFSGLHQLLAPVLAGLEVIPAVQARALRGALGLGESEPDHRLEVLAGTLSLLVAATREQPVLLVIDDAHHLDAGSADALAFVARRLHVGGIALIAAKRSNRPSAFDDGSPEELRLGGLTLDEVRELLAESVDAEDVVEHLWRDTGGIPWRSRRSPAALPPTSVRGASRSSASSGCHARAPHLREPHLRAAARDPTGAARGRSERRGLDGDDQRRRLGDRRRPCAAGCRRTGGHRDDP